jgi:large subunit ribosomal protein L17
MRNMATDLILREQIVTTKATAKELCRHVEKLITLAKKDTLASKRKALGYLRKAQVDENTTVVQKLFNEFPKRYANRNGGYTRILKYGNRRGDGAPEVIITFVK